MSVLPLEAVLETVPFCLVGFAIYRIVLNAAFHNTKYLR